MGLRNDPRTRPDLADVKYKVGCELLEAGDHENALAIFREAVQHDPGHVEAHAGLGKAHYRLRAYVEARDAYRVVVHRQPKHPEAQFKLGLIHLALKDYDLAKAKYEVLLPLDRHLANQLYSAMPRSVLRPPLADADLVLERYRHRVSAWRRGKDLNFPSVCISPRQVLDSGDETWFQFLWECSDIEVEDLLVALMRGDD